MLALLLTVTAAREMPAGPGEMQPAGPLSASVAQSYADLDAVQDHILAAQAEESKEMDRILGPAPKSLQPSSLMQTGEKDPGVLDFSKLDGIQEKLNSLHTKMGGELQNLKKITSDDEDFEKKAKDEAHAAEEAAADPSSLLQTKAAEKDPDAPLRRMVSQLKVMHDLFSPLRKHLSSVKDSNSTFETKQMYGLNKMNNNVIKMMLKLVGAMHKKDPAEQKNAMEELHKGMASVRLQMMQQHDAMEAHKQNKPLAPINERLKVAMDAALTPLKARLDKMWDMDPKLAEKFDVPEAQKKLAEMRALAEHVSDSIGSAAEKAVQAKTPEEAEAIDAGLKQELSAAQQNLRVTFGQLQELTQAMALMPPHKGAKLVPYAQHTKAVRERILRVIQRKPELAKTKIVEAALTHAAAIDGLSHGYERVIALIPQLTKDVPDQAGKNGVMKHIRSVLGAVKMEADEHDRKLNQLAPILERLAGTDVPASLTQTEKTEKAPNFTPLLSASVGASEQADEAGYKKIEQKLEAMQDHISTQVSSLKQTAQQEQNEQVQQLDALMTPQSPQVPMALTEEKAKVAIDAAGKTALRREPVNATV